MDNNPLDKMYHYCNLLKNKCLTREIKEYLTGYVVEVTDNKLKTNEINLINNLGNRIEIIFMNNYFSMKKINKNSVEKTIIYPYEHTTDQVPYSSLLMQQRIIEKRENGLLVKELEKHYNRSPKYNNEIILTDLTEERYTYTKESAQKLFKDLSFEKITPEYFLLKTEQLEICFNPLYNSCDYSSIFESHTNYHHNLIRENIYPNQTYLNSEDVTKIYDLIDGENKIYRIYDLYQGIINLRNQEDINSINLGLLSQDSYDLVTLRGITTKENYLIGSSHKETEEYYNFLKKLFKTKFKYQKEFNLDRDTILKIINYQLKSEITPPKEYTNIDKLIEKKHKKKIKKLLRNIFEKR